MLQSMNYFSHMVRFLTLCMTFCFPIILQFNIQGSVHHKYIPLDIFPTRCNITQFIYFWKTALHVSGGISTHHQEHTQLYLQYLVLVNHYCCLPLLWERWSWSQKKTSSKSSTI